MPDTSEPRFHVDFLIRVFGMDADSRPFSQNVHARNISDHGAKLSGLEKKLRPGDIIGVQFGDQKARCKVVWAAEAGVLKIEVGVSMVDGEPCPWQKQRATQRANDAVPYPRNAPAVKEKRKFPRHRIPFTIEIRDGKSIRSHTRTKTQDIAGSGCYVHTMIPLPVRTTLQVTFWLDSEQVQTSAIVRTSDGGVGMGIEFVGLDEAAQKQLQQQLEALAAKAAPLKKARGV